MASKNKHPFKVEEGHVIYPAFFSDGIQYYYIKDTFNTFAARALDALAIYEQWQMRCSREFLIAHVQAVNKTLSDPAKINIVNLVKLNSALAERLDFAIPSEDLVWQFAAVVFFDEKESPYRYDHQYGKEKIARWRKDMKVSDFFFRTPIGELIPLPQLSEKDLATYSKVAGMMTQKHLKQALEVLSPAGPNRDLLQALSYQESLLSTSAS